MPQQNQEPIGAAPGPFNAGDVTGAELALKADKANPLLTGIVKILDTLRGGTDGAGFLHIYAAGLKLGSWFSTAANPATLTSPSALIITYQTAGGILNLPVAPAVAEFLIIKSDNVAFTLEGSGADTIDGAANIAFLANDCHAVICSSTGAPNRWLKLW